MTPPPPTVLPNHKGPTPHITPLDILSGRGIRIRSNPGNVHFYNQIVPSYMEEFWDATLPRGEKANVAARLVEEVRRGSDGGSSSSPQCQGGRFLKEMKERPGWYVEIGDVMARRKVVQAFSDVKSGRHLQRQPKPKATKSPKTPQPRKKKRHDKKTTIQKPTPGKSPSSNKRKSSAMAVTNGCIPTNNSFFHNSHHHSHHGSNPKQPMQHHQQQRAGRLVILRPSPTMNNDIDATSSDQNRQQWPLYQRHCRSYGFAVEVVQELKQDNGTKSGGGDDDASSGNNDGGGPRTSLLLVKHNQKRAKNPLRCIAERLIVRTRHSLDGNRNSNNIDTLPQHMKNGDIIQTLDGVPNPTFGMLYSMMCHNEKLVLELVAGKGNVHDNDDDNDDDNDHDREEVEDDDIDGDDDGMDADRSQGKSAGVQDAAHDSSAKNNAVGRTTSHSVSAAANIHDKEERQSSMNASDPANKPIHVAPPAPQKNGNDADQSSMGSGSDDEDSSNANESAVLPTRQGRSITNNVTSAGVSSNVTTTAVAQESSSSDDATNTNSDLSESALPMQCDLSSPGKTHHSRWGRTKSPPRSTNLGNEEEQSAGELATLKPSRVDPALLADFSRNLKAAPAPLLDDPIEEEEQEQQEPIIRQDPPNSRSKALPSPFLLRAKREEDPSCGSPLSEPLPSPFLLARNTTAEEDDDERSSLSRALPNPFLLRGKHRANSTSMNNPTSSEQHQQVQADGIEITTKTANGHLQTGTKRSHNEEEDVEELALFDMVEEQLKGDVPMEIENVQAVDNDTDTAFNDAKSAADTTNSTNDNDNDSADSTGDNEDDDDDHITISSSSTTSSSGSSSSCPSSDSSSSSIKSIPTKKNCKPATMVSSVKPSSRPSQKPCQKNKFRPIALKTKPTALQQQLVTNRPQNVPSKPAPSLPQVARKRPPSTTPASLRIPPVTTSASSSIPAYPSHSSKLEAPPTSLSRLWPDPSDVIKALTRWQPPIATVRANPRGHEVVEFYGQIQFNATRLDKGNPLLVSSIPGGQTGGGSGENNSGGSSRKNCNDTIPKEFKNSNEIMAALAHPLMDEGLSSLNGEYHANKFGNGRWNRDLYHLKLSKLTEVAPIFQSESYFQGNIKMYEVQFNANGETNLPPSNLSELYCIHFQGWSDCKFGIVAHDFPTTITFRKFIDGKSLLKIWLVVNQNERETKDTGWLSRKDFRKLLDPHKNGLAVNPNATFTLISCGSTTNIVRQFEAIKCISYLKPHLQKALFTSRITTSSKVAPTSKPRSLPLDIWRSLKNSHNSYQLSSISQVLTGSCRDNVCLVQGPPGTGKSSTIVGLVSALLSGKAALPGGRQSGCLIHPGKTMGATLRTEPHARNRILVCAATNQAVDTLAWKIKQGSLGPSGKAGDFNLARFGSLPWELSRDATHQKPALLSKMEDFLYEVNVDRKASEGTHEVEYNDDEEHEEIAGWSPEKAKQPKRKKRRKIIGKAKLRSQVLGSCSVVVATLSGAGSKAFVDAVCRDPTRNDSEFDAVIIDEACQASEPESLIPFKYNPTTITFVGDPKQLPVLTLSGCSSNSKLIERSLFERLQSLNFPTIFLRNQYRMHEEIAAFPSQEFYDGRLITPDSIKDRMTPSWSSPCFPTLCFWDTNGQKMSPGPNGHGFINRDEADFITQTILSTFAHTFLKQSDTEVTVGIISFYKDQVKILKEQLAKIPALNNKSWLNIKVATVDGFQGSECDIIILSCVRSHSRSNRGSGQRRATVGFLNDYRRVNVALTRAKCSLWIVGNAAVLNTSDLWRKLIAHMDKHRVIRHGNDFRDLFARWRSS